MDQYALIDHATLVRNLNAVCKHLGWLVNGTRSPGGPPSLTYSDTEYAIPRVLYDIAVGAGWINEQQDLEEREYNSRDDVDLFGGEYHFTVSFNEWFLELISETLGDLEEIAEKNAEKQEQYQHKLTQWQMDSINLNSPRNKDKHPILVKFFSESKEFVNVTDLANEADRVGRAMTPPVAVTRVSVSRIYNQHGYVGPRILAVVASVVKATVPCTRDDLYTPKREKKQQS